jgi:hypothetical protein
MRRRLRIIFVLGAFAALAVSTTGTAGVARDTGTVPAVVSAPTAVTLAATKSVVTVNHLDPKAKFTTLTGRVTPAESGVPIELWAKRVYETAFTRFTTTETTSDGRFSISPGTVVKTAYQVRVPATPGATGVVSSNVVTVNVRVTVDFERARPGGFRLYVFPTGYRLNGKFVLIQRSRSSRGPWVTLRRVTLRVFRGDFIPTSFSLRLPRGTSYLRARLPARQAAPGYVASTSKTMAVKR